MTPFAELTMKAQPLPIGNPDHFVRDQDRSSSECSPLPLGTDRGSRRRRAAA
jgi:hypothetical protein